MPKAFILATGADTAGTAVRLAWAFQALEAPGRSGPTLAQPEGSPYVAPQLIPRWRVRSMVSMRNYLEYPADLPYSRRNMIAMYREADLVQMHSTLHGHHWYDDAQGKPTIVMHHGFHYGHFSQNIHEVVAEASQVGATQVGSTVNLELLAPLGPPGPHSVTWTPTPYDLDNLRRLRRTMYRPESGSWGGHPTQLVRVIHAPTDRAIKSTEAVISAVRSLRERGFPVSLTLVEHQTHAETMRIKAELGDILVDQLNLGYGCNAIEAWALGMPVIGAVNAHPEWREHMIRRFGLSESPTGLPFYEATEDTLEMVLGQLVLSRTAREEWAGIGLAHVHRHHSQESVVRLMREIYDEAVLRPTIPSSPLVKKRGLGMSREDALERMRAARSARLADAALSIKEA